MTKCDKVGSGVEPKSDVTHLNFFISNFILHCCRIRLCGCETYYLFPDVQARDRNNRRLSAKTDSISKKADRSEIAIGEKSRFDYYINV